MLCDYRDIIEAAGTPLWWDLHGVPRYAPFEPGMLGVYDQFALLVRIECQACALPMSVGQGWPKWSTELKTFEANDRQWDVVQHSLQELAEGYRYGDPPWHGCPGAGESMSSVAVRIEEAWDRARLVWSRRPEIELLDVRPQWVVDELP